MRAGDGGREQNGVTAELHRERGVRRGADAGVEDDGDARPLDDHGDVVRVRDTQPGTDGGAQRHDRRAAGLLEPPREDRVVVGVRQHGEAVGHQLLGRVEQLDRVGQQRVLVGDHLELDQVGLERLAREPGGEHGVPGGEAPGGVGQHLDAVFAQQTEQCTLG